MKVDIKITGLDQALAAISSLSERRLHAATATALTRTAVKVRDVVRAELPRLFDRPTPYTLNSMYVRPATAQRLQAEVGFKDEASLAVATPATRFLRANVEGGPRRLKRLEVALNAIGALPTGWQVVPGQGARLDAYGNVSRGQVIQVLSQLRITLVAGYTRNMAFDARKQIRAQRKAGGRFFVVQPGGKMTPGVYQREFTGRNVTPVFVFVKATAYRRRLDFDRMAAAIAQREAPGEFARALSEQTQRALAAGGAR